MRTKREFIKLAILTFMSTESKRVAIIGAGAAGLVAADVFRNLPFDVTVFEKSPFVGGVWKFDGASPMYNSLVTNLPVEIMEINAAHPFKKKSSESSFVGHRRVAEYLEEFCREKKIDSCTRFSTTVTSVRRSSSKWLLTSQKDGDCNLEEELFDNIVVCSGHHSKPFTPDIKGIHNFQGVKMHSSDYPKTSPDFFKDKRVLVLGARFSAMDISREVAQYASQVIISDRNLVDEMRFYDKIHHVPSVSRILEDGSVVLSNDHRVSGVDIILFCTGFVYDFPFLCTSSGLINDSPYDVLIDQGRAVLNLYQHIFLNDDPSMAFIGLPWSTIQFHLFYLQALWISRIFSNTLELPTKRERDEWIAHHRRNLEQIKDYPHKYHFLGDGQGAYLRYIASEAGVFGIDEDCYIKTMQEIYDDNKRNFPLYPGGPDDFRKRSYDVDRSTGSWTVTS